MCDERIVIERDGELIQLIMVCRYIIYEGEKSLLVQFLEVQTEAAGIQDSPLKRVIYNPEGTMDRILDNKDAPGPSNGN